MSLPRVLLAEDDSFLAHLVRQTLEDAGFRVFIARNGEEAVSMADYEMPDMVILDVNMPRLNGIEALRQIRIDYHQHFQTLGIGTLLNEPHDMPKHVVEHEFRGINRQLARFDLR